MSKAVKGVGSGIKLLAELIFRERLRKSILALKQAIKYH